MKNLQESIRTPRRGRPLLPWALALAALSLLCLSFAQEEAAAPPAARVLYVDAVNGSDDASGASPDEALRTLGAAAALVNGAPQASNDILLLPGTYTGEGNRNLAFGAYDVRIASTAGAAATLVDLEGGAFLSLPGMCNGATATVEGLTVSRGGGGGAAILASGMDLALRDCVLSDNAGAWGAVCVEGGRAEISGTTFTGNSATGGAGALTLAWSEGSAVADCDFLWNTGQTTSAAALTDSTADFSRCRFAGNATSCAGCAIRSESSYGTVSSLSMHDCLVQSGDACDPLAPSGVWSTDGGEVELLNCTLTGGGVLLQSDGMTRLNNTILDGSASLPEGTVADNTYSQNDLSASGTGNIEGSSPGIDSEGGLLPGSPCIGAGNSVDVSGTDLNGTPRDTGSVSIGCSESAAAGSGEDHSAAPETEASGTASRSHSGAYALRFMSALYLPCSELAAYGSGSARVLDLFNRQLGTAVTVDGSCTVSGGDGEDRRCTERLGPVAVGFAGSRREHPLLPGEALPGCLAVKVAYGCPHAPRMETVVPLAEDHRLAWTADGGGTVNCGCAMEGRIPEDRRCVRRQSLRVPLGQTLRLNVDWTGGTCPPEGAGGNGASYPYPQETGLGCLLFTRMACGVCRKEWTASPMPSWQHRCLMHHACYFGPDVTAPEAFEEAMAKLAGLSFGVAWSEPEVMPQLSSAGAQYTQTEYSVTCDEAGTRDYTFRRVCLPYTVHPGDITFRPGGVACTVAEDVQVGACGKTGEFTYDVTTVGVAGLTAELDTSATAAQPVRTAALPACVVEGDDGAPLHCLFVPSQVYLQYGFGCRLREARPASTLHFRALPDGGKWPAEADYPYDDFPEGGRSCWKFPEWSVSRLDEGAGNGSCGGIGFAFWGIPELNCQMQMLNKGSRNGEDEVDISFNGSPGAYAVSASCHVRDWLPPDGEAVWNDGTKTLNVFACDIQADMLDVNGAMSPFPLLLLNDDCDDDSACEYYWRDKEAKRDLERTGPADGDDDDLMPVRIRIPDVFGGNRQLLDRLRIRVSASGGLRLFADRRKHPLGHADCRWTRENDSEWLFRVYNHRRRRQADAIGDQRLAAGLEPCLECTVYVEGCDASPQNLSATLAVIGDDGTPMDVTADRLDIPVIRAGLAPDYDRDGAITKEEETHALLGRPLRMWYNSNTDIDGENLWDFESGGSSNGLANVLLRHPEATGMRNSRSDVIDGCGDLLDFFPVWLDAKEFLSLSAKGCRFRLGLSHTTEELNVVYTDMKRSETGDFRTQNGAHAIAGIGALCDLNDARVTPLQGAVKPPEEFLRKCRSGEEGVLICEARERQSSHRPSRLRLELYIDQVDVYGVVTSTCLAGRRELRTAITDALDMYRYYDFRGFEGGAERLTRLISPKSSLLTAADRAFFADYPYPMPNGNLPCGEWNGHFAEEPENLPDSETGPVRFIFVHGFNVSSGESADWQDRMFKRLYQSGFQGRFVGIDWKGDEAAWRGNYHVNAENAFQTAGLLAESMNSLNGSDKVFVLAHSLGNMLVSSAIADHGMRADGFFMFNAAVAAEAYAPERHVTTKAGNRMVPLPWKDYPSYTWAAEWHAFFRDDRGKLTWKNRFGELFEDSGTRVYNFYDNEDEVLGLKGEVPAAEEDEDSAALIMEQLRDTGSESGIQPGFREGDDRLSIAEGSQGCVLKDTFMITVRLLSWQKQEYGKGSQLYVTALAGTDEAGWGFDSLFHPLDEETRKLYLELGYCLTDDARWVMSPQKVRSLGREYFADFDHAMFVHRPARMNDSSLTQEQIDHLLVYAIPALSGTAGHNPVEHVREGGNLARLKDHVWPRTKDFCLEDIWAHSDFMLVPYFYTHRIYEELIRLAK